MQTRPFALVRHSLSCGVGRHENSPWVDPLNARLSPSKLSLSSLSANEPLVKPFMGEESSFCQHRLTVYVLCVREDSQMNFKQLSQGSVQTLISFLNAESKFQPF